MELKDRLRLARKAKGLTQTQVAEKIEDLTQSAYSQLESGKSKNTLKAVELAQLFGVNVNWLVTGQGEMTDNKNYGLGNVEPVPNNFDERTRYAPVLNYVQAGVFTEIGDNGYDEYLAYNNDKVSDNAYWLIVKGDSMTPDFQEGDLLLVDANRQPKSGDYVIAKIADENEATFKRYKACGFDEKLSVEYFQLIALNDFYSPIDSRHKSFVILGVVMEHKRRFHHK